MIKYLLFIGLCGAFLTGCSSHDSHQSVTAQGAVSLSRVATAPDATRAANQLVREKGLEWGPAVQVSWQKEYNRFLVIYATPEKEKVMVGDRGVFVETNGEAWLMPQL